MIQNIWNNTTKQWRHIISHLSKEKQERITERVTNNILTHLPTSLTSVIDWGCGGGLISKLFLERGYKVYVVDLIQDSIDNAYRYVNEITYSQLIPENVNEIKYKGPKPDLIFCNEVIQHFPSYEYFTKILSIWTQDISPNYIAIQVKLNNVTKSTDNYEKEFLNGLLFYEDDLIRDFSNKGYKAISKNYSQTVAGIPMGYYIFKKKLND